MKKSAAEEPKTAKLSVSFSLGRNKTVYVVGEYDPSQTPLTERLKYLEIVSRFGHELGSELVHNYNAGLRRVVMCEVDSGSIMFEIETTVSASIRRKAIEKVQQAFDEEKSEALGPRPEPESFVVSGPETPQ